MKEIVVVSGKGGTGKTTVLARYAEIAEGAVVADCDVDAPNLHMLLKPKIIRREPFVGSKVAAVDHEVCDICGQCVGHCRFDALHMVGDGGDKSIEMDADRCEGCAMCANICPVDAIEMRERIVGEWFLSETERGPMVHALLEAGAENSGRLVAMVKQMAKKTAKEKGAETILVDGPPGIGCPVISALSGADLVVIVAEPTISGLSDFKRVADLAGGFRMKCALVVNKSDLNDSMAQSLVEEARSRGVVHIGTVPYDEELLRLMARGEGMGNDSRSPAIAEISKSFEAVLELLAEE